MIRFGVHCSLKKGLAGALDEAHALGCEALQIFTRSPRMWKMRLPEPDEVALFREKRKEHGLYPLVVHTPYLPNLATAQEELYRRSWRSMEDDLAVACDIEADYFVIHPGSYSPESTREQGMRNIVEAINGVLDAVRGRTMVLFENVAGGGRRIGSSFEEIAEMLSAVRQRERAGVCFDTAHALGAGYDLSTEEGVERTLAQFERTIGLARLQVVHFNDSKAPLASQRDRHEHLGKGFVGAKGFKRFVARVKDIAKAGILETPKDTPDADRNNLSLLFRWRTADDR